MEKNFNFEFTNDEEIEKAFDDFVEYMKTLPEPELSVINPHKVRQILEAYKELKMQFRNDKRVEVKCGLNDPFIGVGYISVAGKNICFKKPGCFANIMEAADNFEVYTKINGEVDISFTFYDVAE